MNPNHDATIPLNPVNAGKTELPTPSPRRNLRRSRTQLPSWVVGSVVVAALLGGTTWFALSSSTNSTELEQISDIDGFETAEPFLGAPATSANIGAPVKPGELSVPVPESIEIPLPRRNRPITSPPFKLEILPTYGSRERLRTPR